MDLIERRMTTRPTLAACVALAVVGASSCDQNVKFSVSQSPLTALRAGGSRYAQEGGGAAQCAVNDELIDIGLLPLAPTRGGDDRLLEPGSTLTDCTLELAEGRGDADGFCYLGTDDVAFKLTKVQLTTYEGDAVCCTRSCAAPHPVGGCEALGEGWACNEDRNECEYDKFSLKAISLDWVPVGDSGVGRAVALLMDNSGTLAGKGEDGVPVPENATDQSTGQVDNRIAAAKDFVYALSEGTDRIGVYTFDTAGASGVQSVTEVEANAGASRGFIGSLRLAEEAILKLGSREASGEGSPVFDAVVEAVTDLRTPEAAAGRNPVIVLFTDGKEHSSEADVDAAIEAVLGGPEPADDIPVYVVHLDNVLVMNPIVGRYEPFVRLACVSGGAYFRLEDAAKLGNVFRDHLPFLTRGRYELDASYAMLSAGPESDVFPGDACYGIETQVSMTVEGVDKTVTLSKQAGAGKGARFDTRPHVCKN